MSGGLSRLIHVLSSLRLAVVTMSALGIACIAATFYESAYGTAATQRLFYRSWWFAALLAVLAASILFSALERYPWNRHHVGFVMAHAGILLLLLGSLVSLHGGLDGRIALAEGETSSQLQLDGETVHVGLPDGARVVLPVDFRSRPPRPGTRLPVPGAAATVVVEEYQADASLGDVWAEGLEGQPGVPALQFTLAGQGQPLRGWLMAGAPGPSHVEFGPLVFSLHAAASEKQARELARTARDVNRLAFVMGPGDTLRYAISTRKGEPSSGVVAPGETIATPWMQLSVGVDRVLRHAVKQRVVTRRPAGAREEDRTPAVHLRLETTAGSGGAWLAYGDAEAIDAGGPAQIGYGARASDLPFRLTLIDFRSETYPGSRMAATYESVVRVEDAERGTFERTISMNHPLHHRGYTLFQASYIDGETQTSILSVSRAPGLPLVYLGTALLSLGALWMSFFKRWVARRQGRSALARLRPAVAPAVAFMASVLAASVAGAGTELDALRLVAIQDGGRQKPLDTFARESARRITGAKPFTGGETVKGLDAIEWAVGMLAEPARWQREPIVRVAHADLRQAVGLAEARDRYTYEELVAHEGLRAAIASVQEKLSRDEALGPVDSEVAGLYESLALMRGLLTGEAFRIVPVEGEGGAWLSVADLAPGAPGGHLASLRERLGAVVRAQAAGDRAVLGSAAVALRDELRTLGGPSYATPQLLAREVGYNRLKPFRVAWLLYLAAFLVLLASLPLASRRLGWAGLALAVAGLGYNSYGLLLRTLIAGRAPVTNMYETVVFVAWGAVLLALVFELVYRGRLAATCASGLAVVALILADNVPILDGSITPLVPVLRDNLWLTLHVLTITLGYAAFFLGLGLGHLNLGLFVFAPGRVALLKSLTLFLYRSLQVGTFFLAVGTLLGGVWASYSWGRFWGWDPKETWALIALLGYLALLHGRLIGWVKDFGLAVGAIAGFLLVLMAWYGVNYVLGTGLHAYGFGSGGGGWMLGFATVEMVIVVLALARRVPPPSAAPEPSTAAVR